MQIAIRLNKLSTCNIILVKNVYLANMKKSDCSKFIYLCKRKYTTNKSDKFIRSNFYSDSTSVHKYMHVQGNNFKHRNNDSIKKKLFDKLLDTNETRFNAINLQMLSKKLHNQIFGNELKINLLTESDVLVIKQELANFGIITERTSEIPNVDILIPSLQGQNIEEHFKEIAYQQVEPYLNVINKMLNKLPPVPEHFVFKEGWTRYSNSGYESVDYPEDDGLIFDVEVCVKNGPLPILATAVSKTSWYSWVSKYLIKGASSFMNKLLTPEILIPLESSINDKGLYLNKFQQMPKIVVGHNVSFDRVRVKEQYWLNQSATKFLDTMALHVSVNGLSSYQRSILKSENLKAENDYLNSISSLNNLADVYKLYCNSELNKSGRDIFINGELHQIKEQFNESMSYCASDVIATHDILKKIFPIFIERFPHPATLAGMLELSSTYLPVNYNWNRYLEETETTYEDINLESKVCLSKRADQVCRLLINDKYKKDLWMWDEDWSIKNINLKKGYNNVCARTKVQLTFMTIKSDLNKQFKYLNETKYFLPKKMPHLPGYPNWYRKLCAKQNKNINLFPRAQVLSTSMLITPKLLNLTWECYPLYHIKKHGWGFLVSNKSNNKYFNTKQSINEMMIKLKSNKTFFVNKTLITSDTENELNNLLLDQSFSNSMHKNSRKIVQPDAELNKGCYFFKLPHKNGMSFNVGNPLSKDFLNNFSDNVLAGINISTSRIIEISKMSSYWKNNRDRILSQLVIWLDNNNKQSNLNLENKINLTNAGAIIPQIVVSGTLTRRAVERTWMTASNAHSDRIGSELRAMISAPLNYSIVGADVDSQELWIASIIGDAFSKNIKIQGATPFSWMTLIGNKSEGTDMHSVTAKAIGISRDQAKILNYARIYGAGQKFAERLLKQFNPAMTDKEATLKSKKMFFMTKGQKCYRIKKNYLSESFNDKVYTAYEAFKISQLHGKTRDEVFEKGKWVGGSESAMFNSLEEIAEQNEPTTPFLNARLSRALENEGNAKYLPTKINWVVQSGAVDFLHLILVSMRWLMKDKARLCLSFHDEVRYLVPSKYKYNAALAMHVTNLLVRCFFVSRLKMKDLPMSVAFFTAVEVDSVLRKEATQDCRTPSNPHGLEKGYGIHQGENLNVWTAVEKSNGYVGMITLNLKKNV